MKHVPYDSSYRSLFVASNGKYFGAYGIYEYIAEWDWYAN